MIVLLSLREVNEDPIWKVCGFANMRISYLKVPVFRQKTLISTFLLLLKLQVWRPQNKAWTYRILVILILYGLIELLLTTTFLIIIIIRAVFDLKIEFFGLSLKLFCEIANRAHSLLGLQLSELRDVLHEFVISPHVVCESCHENEFWH